MSEYPRGSEWRRWDLHLHTASSYDYDYLASDSDKILCERLRENNIALVAITDHFTIEEKRITDLRNLAPEIAFLPGVELRTDKGDTNIHVVLIFSDELDLKELCEDFNSFKRSNAKNKDDNEKIYWDYKDILEFAKLHEALISIHAGRKTSGVDDKISNSLPHNQAVKSEYASTVNIFEMGQLRDLDDYKSKVFPSIGKKAMIICSDNHDARIYTTSEKLWIKADPTFNGLQQVIFEPERVFLGDIPPALDRVQKNKTKTLDKMTIDWDKSYSGSNGEWFNNVEIIFNPEMTAVIGNKGSGKTAIAEIVALLSNSHNLAEFTFLNAKKFKSKKLAKNFNATLTWHEDAFEVTKNLNDDINIHSDELVHFVPQNSFESFCNDSVEDFVNEINGVVFSRMYDKDKLGYASFDELLKYKTSAIENRKSELFLQIDTLNKEIKSLEEKRDSDYKTTLINTRATLQRELDEHQKNKPNIINPPEDLNTEEYQALISKLKLVDEIFNEKQSHLELLLKQRSKLSIIKENLENLEESIKEKVNLISAELLDFDIDIDSAFKYSFNFFPILSLLENRNEEISLIEHSISDISEDPNSLLNQKTIIEAQINIFNEENQGRLTQYQKYLTALKEWEDNSKDISEKISLFDFQIEYLGDLKDSQLIVDTNKLKADRLDRVARIFECYEEEIKVYDTFKQPIIEFLNDYKEQLQNFDAEIKTGIYATDEFVNMFVENYIDNNFNGPFKGSNGLKYIKELVNESDFSSVEGVKQFINLIQESFDKSDESKCYHKMFKKDKYDAFAEMFYKLKFLDARYSLQLFGKELNSLSPGERGSLLLVFYLLLDARDIPLILDQPEDNLDNQSVAEILVPFIREAKKRRQIIIITHNSNLAVVSDAEQIIRVNINKLQNNKFTFKSGSLESEIIDDVVDVLEGTKKSFSIRKNKYLF